MRLLCIGDIVSREGVEALERTLPRLKREYSPDAVIVNGENAALGNGIGAAAYRAIMAAGADVVTGGNHSFQKRAAADLHDEEKRLLRPANLPEAPGRGELTLDLGRQRLRVISLSGSLFMSECVNPFEYMDGVLDEGAVTVVDFHAEATSEKRALGFYLDGRVSLVFGTHTHVRTADAQILPRGTGYITDIGMTGVRDSVLGKDAQVCVRNFRWPGDRQPTRDAKGECVLSGIFAEIGTDKKCARIEAFTVDNA